MKSKNLILTLTFLITLAFSLQPAGAQEKSREEREREYRIQEEIDKKKKELTETQRKALEETQKDLDAQKKNIDEALKIFENTKMENPDLQEFFQNYRNYGGKSLYMGDPWGGAPGMGSYYGHAFGGDAERTSWDFVKSIKENSFKRDYIIDIDKSVKTVVMAVTGDCKAGEIRIKILMPDGKTYSDIVIDEFINLNWRKSFNISEEENQDKVGAWKFQIGASEATGYFKISLQTF